MEGDGPLALGAYECLMSLFQAEHYHNVDAGQTSLPMEIPGMKSNWLRTLGHAFLQPIYKLDAD